MKKNKVIEQDHKIKNTIKNMFKKKLVLNINYNKIMIPKSIIVKNLTDMSSMII